MKVEIKFLDLWNGVPIGLPKYIGFLPYILWVEQLQTGILYFGFLNFAIVLIVHRIN